MAEAGNLKKFKHVRQFLKYCGFDLATYKSETLSQIGYTSENNYLTDQHVVNIITMCLYCKSRENNGTLYPTISMVTEV